MEGSCSSSTNDHKYDVFLSFRGVDTRHSFTDHLHKAFIDANISTFLDDKEIETGGDLKPELASAIKASRASIIVLSKNYANSSWCLDELVLILEQRITSNQIVIPIFYRVEPNHVRKQQSSFGDAIAKHKQAMETETNVNKRSQHAQKIERWIKALTEVANLKGKNAYGRLETEFIEEIVEEIYHRLHVPLGSALPLLIGVDYFIEIVTSWLKDASSNTGDILTILGMGGIGKTSLAKYVYGLHRREFDTSIFIEDISRRCANKFNGLLDLQKQLYDDLSNRSSIQVHDVSVYTLKIENAVACKPVFLVLDDIDSLDQLDALLGDKGFHPRSKIVITTKDAWLTESCALFKTHVKPKHAKLELQGLHDVGSRELFCFHAFMCNHPKAGYEKVLEKLVKYCQGHPLALEVLGKSLHNRDVAYWEGCTERLKKEMSFSIENVLRMSFETLSYNDKELFKYIACFFVGKDKDVTQTILQACDVETRCGITNLTDRCLLSIGWRNELLMHQLLQEMGRLEVRRESPEKPWKRSRLWCHDEAFKVLKQKKGTKKVRGLTLDTRMLKNEKLCETFEMETDVFRNMENLMLLQLSYVQVNGSCKKFPEELRWLCMHGFSLKSIPSNLPMENLVALDMSYSNIQSFDACFSNTQPIQARQKLIGSCLKKKGLLGSLKILNLSFCGKLSSLGGFDGLPALENLILTNCIGLVEVCESIEACVELVFVDLSYCYKLEKLPRTMGMLKKVKTLVLDGCNLGESQMSIRDMDSPEMLKANINGINTRTSSSTFLQAIPNHSKFFSVSLPSSLVRLSLANNNLSNESFPMDFSGLSMLKELHLDKNPILTLPNCVRSLPKIEILSMVDCYMLRSVEHPPHTLTHLVLVVLNGFKKPSLEYIVFDSEMSPLRLNIGWRSLAPSSFEIEGRVKVQPMVDVEENVLCGLGWTNLDFLDRRHKKLGVMMSQELEVFENQMYYEYGIFSTFYGGEEIPNWVSRRSKGPSISFTIPSIPYSIIPSMSYKIRGLNFCFVRWPSYLDAIYLPLIKISNITKNRTWTYRHYIEGRVSVGGECLTFLSHWMFGKNEMEGGDHVTITLADQYRNLEGGMQHRHLVKECGVSFVYDDGKTDEEDVLGYYKSWNHIIGGDLSTFQTSTGEYHLSNRFWLYGSDQYGWCTSREKKAWFRALSQRKSNILGQAREAHLSNWRKRTVEREERDRRNKRKEVVIHANEALEEQRLNCLISNHFAILSPREQHHSSFGCDPDKNEDLV